MLGYAERTGDASWGSLGLATASFSGRFVGNQRYHAGMAAKTGVAPKIRKLKLRHPELSHADIAKRVGCQPSNVTGVLKAFLGNRSADTLRDFQESKADVYDALQLRVLSSVTQSKLLKAPAMALVTSAAILEDKARLVRGQATGINVNVLLDVVEAMRNRPSPGNSQPIRDTSADEPAGS